MYRYADFDAAFVRQRAAQFRAQVARRLDGSLTEEEFRPLRLMNGLYSQLHAYMLRVAIPYGTLSSVQMRALADIATRWDRGYGHFTTRQNIQFNWPRLVDVPDIIDALADVQMHAIQTSGNCIRNVTTDAFAGAAADEIEDPRPYAELIRQWSSDHAEFQFLPRKFKIAITGSPADRAATAAHDIGLQLVEQDGETGFRVAVGGGLGRSPILASPLRAFLPKAELLPYLEAIVSAYNLLGRRDNKYKARIKITVLEAGIEAFRAAVETEFCRIRPGYGGADQAILARIAADFAPPDWRANDPADFARSLAVDPLLAAWAARSVSAHKRADHAVVTVSLKTPGEEPGDASAAQMRALADLAEAHSYGELRVSHRQNIVLAHVPRAELAQLHAGLLRAGLATANIGLVSDIIACPGMDYCALATARSIPLAQDIALHFQSLGLENTIGALSVKISGCINACGHHHLGGIGILGLDRAGVKPTRSPWAGIRGGNRARPRSAKRPAPDLPMTRWCPRWSGCCGPIWGRGSALTNPLWRRCAGLAPARSRPRFTVWRQRKGLWRKGRKMMRPDIGPRVAALNARYRHHAAVAVMDHALRDPDTGRVALVSSFGAESVVLLHMVALLAPRTPVLFVDTLLLFAETLAYQQSLAQHLGLRDLRVIRAAPARLAQHDPEGSLHRIDPDACCALRKTAPLEAALTGFDGWITGRKRYQGATRADLDFFEVETPQRMKINPLAHWGRGDIEEYIVQNRLPRHPLVARGYPSIGCAPCTSAVAAGEDPRAGRWRGAEKTECGIHFTGGKAVRGPRPAPAETEQVA